MKTSAFGFRTALPLLLLSFMSPLSLHAAEPMPRTVIVFGDSLTAGNALPPANRESAWIRIVEKELAGKLKMINEGKGGRPTDSIKEFEEMLARNPQADLLVLALGTNDSRTVDGTCVSTAVKNLAAMIGLARKHYRADLPILLVGPPNIRKDALGPSKPIADQREQNLKDLNSAYEKLAAEAHCEFVSLYGAVPEDSLAKDGVHPDAAGNGSAGNEAIAKVLLPKLLPQSP